MSLDLINRLETLNPALFIKKLKCIIKWFKKYLEVTF